jgi:hypothetical protein
MISFGVLMEPQIAPCSFISFQKASRALHAEQKNHNRNSEARKGVRIVILRRRLVQEFPAHSVWARTRPKQAPPFLPSTRTIIVQMDGSFGGYPERG